MTRTRLSVEDENTLKTYREKAGNLPLGSDVFITVNIVLEVIDSELRLANPDYQRIHEAIAILKMWIDLMT